MKNLIYIFVFLSINCSAQYYGLNRNYLDSCNISPIHYTGSEFSIVNESGNGQGVEISPDGTKMYVGDQTADSVFQYTLSSPFDVSSASYDNISFYIGGQSGFINDLFIRNDGLKLFIIDLISNFVLSYSMSTAFDLSTASYDNISFNSGGKVIDAYSLDFNPDGSKMYIVDVRVDSLYQYSITSWDISTATYDNKSLYVKRPLTNTTRVRFCGSGDALYIANKQSTVISFYQFNMSTSWDISTATGIGEYDIDGISTLQSFDVSSTNKKMILMDNSSDKAFTTTY